MKDSPAEKLCDQSEQIATTLAYIKQGFKMAQVTDLNMTKYCPNPTAEDFWPKIARLVFHLVLAPHWSGLSSSNA